MSVKVITNFKEKSREMAEFTSDVKKHAFQVGMTRLLDEVGFTSVQEFMDTSNKGKPHKRKLTMRDGRLAASIVGAYKFGVGGSDASQGIKESIRKVKIGVTGVEGIIGSKVPYAEIHEHGGTIRPKNQ